ncbi:MAG: hypothetical protein U0R69_01895 [Gaiellales bacterium]
MVALRPASPATRSLCEALEVTSEQDHNGEGEPVVLARLDNLEP